MKREARRTRGQPRGAKKALFALIALALPFVLVGLTELGLRWAGYGGFGTTYHVAATTPDGRTLIAVTNERVDTFFFKNRDLPGQMSPTFYWEPKAPNGVRVMIVGESAIKGFPQPTSLTAAAFLEQMLTDALPDRDVKVVNLGTTAIASYPILELGTEALDHDPDVLIVQAGNNEFFGAFGVASLNSAGNSPMAIAFQRWGKSLGIVQWGEGLVAKMRGPAKPMKNSSATLMERMVGRDYTAPNDPLRAAAARNIQAHIHELIRRAERRGVPVVVCITGTNERGMAPLGESTVDGVAESDRPRFDGLMALDPEDAGAHVDDLRWAVSVAPEHARAHWMLGTGLHARGDFDGARAEFDRAVDLDPMPWRATTQIMDAVRGAMVGTGAVECDARAAMRDASEGGTIGWNLMVDHVHMDVAGQEIVARALFDALTRVPSLGIPADASSRVADDSAYEARLGATEFDAHGVAFRMFKLLQVPFFERTNPWAARIMSQRMLELEALMSPTERKAMEAWQDRRASLDYAIPASAFAGQVCMAEQRYDQGERVYHAATMAVEPYTYLSLEYTYRWIGCAMRAHGDVLTDEEQRIAQAALDRGLVMLASADTSAPPINRYVGSLMALLGDCVGAVPHLQEGKYGYRDMELVQIDAQIVECLVKLGRLGDARQIVEYGWKNAGPFAPLYRQMAGMLQGGGSPGG